MRYNYSFMGLNFVHYGFKKLKSILVIFFLFKLIFFIGDLSLF
jgi:hypothetical protein